MKHAAHTTGFTLVELMVVVAIIAILAAIAIPQYSSYVTRGKLPEAHSALSDLRVKLEQRFMDNRSYSGGIAPWACGSLAPTITTNTIKYFTYDCVSTATTYTVTATGIPAQGLDGIAFTITESNVKATAVTASTPMANAGYVNATNCWATKPGAC